MAEEQEEEVLIEVEAVEAVYGDDCVVLDSFPPHLHLHIKPRTADVSSQQFVEAVIGIRAGSKYPKEPPHIYLIESKGLDKQREKHLMSSIQEKAQELSSYLMLVALCEEAVEQLSVMNHPEGDCPMCLYPLVPEDENNDTLPFMKLMSCFHCFHSECIIRWWNWLQEEKKLKTTTNSSTPQPVRNLENQNDIHGATEENMGNCPVCRKVFHAKDLEHVVNLVGAHTSQLDSGGTEIGDNELLESDSENIRRQKFEAILKLQQENSGLIEPKTGLVFLPGMFLPQPVTLTSNTPEREIAEQQQRDVDSTVHIETTPGPSDSSNRHSSIRHKNTGRRKPRNQTSGKQSRQWVRRENGAAS